MLTIEPTGAVLGATARGIDLAQPLSERDLGQILLALGRYGVLRFPDQAEIHDRDEALPASQHTAVLRRKFSEEPHRLLQRFRAAIGERRGFHRRTIADAVARVR
jgi:hypothetical protein